MAISTALVLLNRFVLSLQSEKAGALFISWYQFIVAYVIILIVTTFFPHVPLLNLESVSSQRHHPPYDQLQQQVPRVCFGERVSDCALSCDRLQHPSDVPRPVLV
jgi:hypothetical protein